MKPRAARSPKRRGFTLLEVLVAIAILGLSLTAILSSQLTEFTDAATVGHLSIAVGLARCKMNGLEEKLLRDGYPLTEEDDQGPCCGEDVDKNYSCSWKIERVELPEPMQLETQADGGAPPSGASTSTPEAPMAAGDPGTLGPLGAMASVAQSGGSILGDAGVKGLAGLMSAASGGTQGMAPLLMNMVYPELKPMLEASIRKVTVTVTWKTGHRERHMDVTQYVTNPQQGGLFNPLTGQPMPSATGTGPGTTTGGGTNPLQNLFGAHGGAP